MYNRIFALLVAVCFVATTVNGQANRFDVVIDEILADPTPAVGLPAYEFVELRNVSGAAIDLRNWQISDGTSTATIGLSLVVQPDSFVILCPTSAAVLFSPFGRTTGLANFPSLNNDADVITLLSPGGRAIHTVEYTSDWFENSIKSAGGWTLEMVDTHNPCSSHWIASTNPSGGTPGSKNTADGNDPDDLPPALLRTYPESDSAIIAVFDEPLDSNSAAGLSSYQLNNTAPQITNARPLAPLFKRVRLVLASPLSPNTIYTLHVAALTDCAGNSIGALNEAKTGLPVAADSGDVVINEILFNPKTDGYDYVELYNRSEHILDMAQLFVASRDNVGALSNAAAATNETTLFFPGEYVLLTPGRLWLSQNYTVKYPARILETQSLPSLPDDKGEVICAGMQGNVIDELRYEHSWHFALVEDEEGIALERINYNERTQDRSNWTSAASTAGFGTPGYVNSQLRADVQLQGQLAVEPKIFSPDNDGFNDYCTINYQFEQPGYFASVVIFDARGRLVRSLVKAATLEQKGYFIWNGLDDNSKSLGMGIYIIYLEIFNASGKTMKYKLPVTITRKF